MGVSREGREGRRVGSPDSQRGFPVVAGCVELEGLDFPASELLAHCVSSAPTLGVASIAAFVAPGVYRQAAEGR